MHTKLKEEYYELKISTKLLIKIKYEKLKYKNFSIVKSLHAL